jgi:hypothetical protein
MIYAATREEVEARRKAFLRKWRLKCREVANSLDEAGVAAMYSSQTICNVTCLRFSSEGVLNDV